MFRFCRRSFFLTWLLLTSSTEPQSTSIGWQSSIVFSDFGMEYLPVDTQALFLYEIGADSVTTCGQQCHLTDNCRVFDFDSQSNRCRIYDGDTNSIGTITVSSSSESVVGSIELMPEQFVHRGEPCSFCEGSRYLRCVNSTCQCPSYTFYDGSVCQSQRFLDGVCDDDTHCRDGFNLTCSPHLEMYS